MTFPVELFSEGAQVVQVILSQFGFQLTGETKNDASGSHAVHYARDEESFSFTWDGKESWLRMDVKQGEHAAELFFRPLRDATLEQQVRAMQDAIKTLNDVLTAPHDHDHDEHGCCGHHH